jgi:hypothetical protein
MGITMRANKKVLTHLTKCYSLALLTYQGKEHFLVAAEKTDRCLLFDLDGNEEATVWEGPGGVMTMEQIPGTDGCFLSTQEFYSPNDSAKASIVLVEPQEDGSFSKRKILNIPFVHRFGILERGGVRYLLAATLKSAHAYKDDWTCPGRIWVGELPNDLSCFNEENPLPVKALVSGLYRNHGFCKVSRDGISSAIFGSDQGVLRITPPENRDGEWEVETLLCEPTSDMLLIDFDGDGEDELLTLSPFHGDTIRIFKKIDGKYQVIYTYEKPLPFLHAIWAGDLNGEPVAYIGNRNSRRLLLAIRCVDAKELLFCADVLDEGAGPANVLSYKHNGKDYLVAANRETDEVALYELFED